MSALRNMALVLLPLSLACAGVGCAAQTADDEVADEQAQSADVAANGGEDVGDATEACGGFGWGGGWGGCGGWGGWGAHGFWNGCGFPGFFSGFAGFGNTCGGAWGAWGGGWGGGCGRFGGCW